LDAAEEQVLAANVDAVFIVMSLNEDFNLRRLERYITMAWESGAQPVIVLTKTDLCADWELRVLEVEAIAFGVPVHAISNVSGEGLDLVRSHLSPGRTVALLGSSGVGKSTLVNTFAGEELLATQEIREDDGEGRHTTTHRQLVLLPGGGLVLDTPGMRELQLWESSDGISETFSDIEETLPFSRWASYKKLQRELAHLERRLDKRLQAEERRRWAKVGAQGRANMRAKGRR
jgi:ribosome biogenesis GTPase / thiamine phosphate phosphatase